MELNQGRQARTGLTDGVRMARSAESENERSGVSGGHEIQGFFHQKAP